MIFPRLSPYKGKNAVGGNAGIYCNYILIPPMVGDDYPYGTSPVWADQNTIYYTYSRQNPDGTKHAFDGQLMKINFPIMSPPVLVGVLSGNVLTAGGGSYATWRPGVGVQVNNGPAQLDWTNPALSDDGILAHGINGDGRGSFAWGGTTCACYNQITLSIWINLDVTNPGQTWFDAGIERLAGNPIPIWTGREIWLLFNTNDGCVFLMEWGSKLGYVIRPRGWDGGSGYSHDARATDENHIRVISPGFDEIIDLTNTNRVPLPPVNGTEPKPMPCTPVVPTQDIIKQSTDNIRQFCQTFVAPDGSRPYANDEIHDGGLFLSDGLLYFMMSDTGLWAKILMNPDDKRPWPEKRQAADDALFKYMRSRFP